MNSKELGKIKDNLEFFKGVSLEDFEKIEKADISEVCLFNKTAAGITSLLKQIVDYYLVANLLEDEEYEAIIIALKAKNVEDFEKIFDFLDDCKDYVETLIDNGCFHPSVFKIEALLKGILLYNVLNEMVVEMIEDYDNLEIKSDLEHFSEEIDGVMDTIVDNNLIKILSKIENGSLHNAKDVLSELVEFTNMKVRLSLFINDIETTKFNWCGMDVSFYQGGTTLLFTDLFIKIEKYLEDGSYVEEDIKKYLESLKEAYYLYNGYRDRYLVKHYEECFLLEKCHKM